MHDKAIRTNAYFHRIAGLTRSEKGIVSSIALRSVPRNPTRPIREVDAPS